MHSVDMAMAALCAAVGAIPDSLLIVGAGMASVRLAQVVKEHRPETNTTIVEAKDYIGTRVRNMDLDGYSIEMVPIGYRT